MLVQPRTHDAWWVDQHGTKRSNLGLWRAHARDDLRTVLADDDAGVRVEATPDGRLLHLVRLDSYDADPPETAAVTRAVGGRPSRADAADSPDDGDPDAGVAPDRSTGAGVLPRIRALAGR